MPKSLTLLVDIDGILCGQIEGDYKNAIPNEKAIETVNRLYDEGYRIILYTARFMGRAKGSARIAREIGYEFTRKQLEGWGVKFHELKMGKPASDVIIDDRALFFEPNWDRIYAEVKRKSED